MQKLSFINKVLIIVGTIVLLSGIKLHIGYPTLQHDHQQMILWILIHIIVACILLIVVGFHIFYNRWWFKTLKIKALVSSSCLILIVTKDCFIPKEDGMDWYIEEIQTALDYDIKIIPLLFDGIESLSNKQIVEQLKLSFDDDEIEKLTKSQAIPYNFDLSSATFEKLAEFIDKADDTTSSKVKGYVKTAIVTVGVLIAAFVIFVGIGFIWGYYSSGLTDEEFLTENSHIEDDTIIFEFGGLNAKYDLDSDNVYIDLRDFKGELPQSDFEILAHSCSVSGAILLFKQNMSALKYLRYIKGNSKYGKMGQAGVLVGSCLGSFCGFSQGSKWGRTLRQKSQALEFFPKLKDKLTWRPVIEGNVGLLMKYNHNINTNNPIKPPALKKESVKVIEGPLIWIYPDKENKIAYGAGLKDVCLLMRYNDWEIGVKDQAELRDEVERARDLPKIVVFWEIDSIHKEIKRVDLPAGHEGIDFIFPTELSDISLPVELYNEWKLSQ